MTNAESNFQVTVVGAGYWGKNLVRNFHALRSLRAVCDHKPEVLRGIIAQYPRVAAMSSFLTYWRTPLFRVWP